MLLGLFFVQRAMSYWLARFELLLAYQWRGLRPALRRSRAVAAGAVAAGGAVAGGRSGHAWPISRERGLQACRWSRSIVLFGPALLLNLLQPVIERLCVKPDELRVEKPYLERNIDADPAGLSSSTAST